MIELTDQHIFVFGGSRGIGRAVAILSAKAGANVTVGFHTDGAAAEEVCEKINSMGRNAIKVQCDASVDGEVKRAYAESVNSLGRINGVCIAAGIFKPTPIDSTSVEEWDSTFDINLRSTFLSVRDCLPYIADKNGSIVIITSAAGQLGSSIYSAYATSKAAQMNFMRSMAKELGERSIRVNCVAPGWTETDLVKKTLDSIGRDTVVRDIPLGRLGRPEDTGYAACFLMSPISSFITGSTITVNGGFHMPP